MAWEEPCVSGWVILPLYLLSFSGTNGLLKRLILCGSGRWLRIAAHDYSPGSKCHCSVSGFARGGAIDADRRARRCASLRAVSFATRLSAERTISPRERLSG